MTLYRMEQGSAAVSLGMYLHVLAVRKLEADLDLVASDDALGRSLQDDALPGRRRARLKSANTPAQPVSGSRRRGSSI